MDLIYPINTKASLYKIEPSMVSFFKKVRDTNEVGTSYSSPVKGKDE